jgi:hypothetical protein
MNDRLKQVSPGCRFVLVGRRHELLEAPFRNSFYSYPRDGKPLSKTEHDMGACAARKNIIARA